MTSRRSPTGDAQEGNYPEVRRQLITLIRQGRRTAQFTRKRPTDLRFGEVLNPESGIPLTRSSAWREIVRVFRSNAPLQKTQLHQPRGGKAWVCRTRLAPDQPLVYIKIELVGGSRVFLRSFHLDEHGNE